MAFRIRLIGDAPAVKLRAKVRQEHEVDDQRPGRSRP